MEAAADARARAGARRCCGGGAAPKRQEKKKPAPPQKNDKKPKKRPRRSPWHLYERLRPVLRPHASDELDGKYMEHHTGLDAELRLIQDELRSRLAPATEDEWRTASGFHNTGADLAALGKKESEVGQALPGHGYVEEERGRDRVFTCQGRGRRGHCAGAVPVAAGLFSS